MNEDKFNKEKIEAYLLGSLSGEEAERFDELGFTDDDFADALKSSENDLIDRYVNGELRGATLENFESFYLASPLRREKVEFARQLQSLAGREIAAANNFASEKTIAKEESQSGFFASLNIFKNQNSFWQFGFAAATILFLILGGFLIFRNMFNPVDTETAQIDFNSNIERPTPRAEQTGAANLPDQTNNARVENQNSPNQNSPSNKTDLTNKKTPTEPAPTPKPKEGVLPSKPIVASFLLLPSLRGGSRIQSVSIDKNITDAAARLRLEADDYPAYRVKLIDQTSGKILWQSSALKLKSAGAEKQLNVGFPAKLLKSHIYTLQVSGILAAGEPEIVGDYSFRVVR